MIILLANFLSCAIALTPYVILFVVSMQTSTFRRINAHFIHADARAILLAFFAIFQSISFRSTMHIEKREGYYHALITALSKIFLATSHGEQSSNKGFSDIVYEFTGKIVCLELKTVDRLHKDTIKTAVKKAYKQMIQQNYLKNYKFSEDDVLGMAVIILPDEDRAVYIGEHSYKRISDCVKVHNTDELWNESCHAKQLPAVQSQLNFVILCYVVIIILYIILTTERMNTIVVLLCIVNIRRINLGRLEQQVSERVISQEAGKNT